MNDPVEPGALQPTGDRVVAVTVEDPVLGGLLRLSLGAQRTVLVGKNGAGKSRLLEDLHSAAFAAVNFMMTASPARVKLELALGGAALEYSYVAGPGVDSDPGDRMSWYWKERCVDEGSGKELWRIEDGIATVAGGGQMAVLPILGLLHLRRTSAFPLPRQVEPLRRLLGGVHLVRAGVPRHGPGREALRLQGPRRGGAVQSAPHWTGQGDERSIEVIKTLATWFELERDRFDAVVAIGRRLEVLQELVVQIKDLEVHAKQPQAPAQEAEVFVDGVNFGYLSDGTQRLIELVITLVDPVVTVLLLEEPETSVHPGLLRRLLAELEALGPGRQVVISTHSPMVLDWTAAEELRLVERTPEGLTSVRSLSAEEQARLRLYLDDDLALSDFMLSGAMD